MRADYPPHSQPLPAAQALTAATSLIADGQSRNTDPFAGHESEAMPAECKAMVTRAIRILSAAEDDTFSHAIEAEVKRLWAGKPVFARDCGLGCLCLHAIVGWEPCACAQTCLGGFVMTVCGPSVGFAMSEVRVQQIGHHCNVLNHVRDPCLRPV